MAVTAVFNNESTNFQPSEDLNHLFLRMQQNYANHLLRTRGHIFLNEIFDALGLPRTREGVLLGWLNDEETSVDFGLEDRSRKEGFLLTFNVTGEIHDKI